MSDRQHKRNSVDKSWQTWYCWPQLGDSKDNHTGDEADEVIDTETEHQADKNVG